MTASAHTDLAAAAQYPGSLADAVREAAATLDREEHRYVERYVACPNGCEFADGAGPTLRRTAGPADCDLCFAGSYEDEDAPQLNPLLGALTIAAASLEAIPTWVGPFVRYALGATEELEVNGPAVPERLRDLLATAHTSCDDPACRVHGIAASNRRQSDFYAANDRTIVAGPGEDD